MARDLTQYEQQRNANIERNRQRMKELGISQKCQELKHACVKPESRKPARTYPKPAKELRPKPPSPPRRSKRMKNDVNYSENASPVPETAKQRRVAPPKAVSAEELQALRQKRMESAPQRARDSGLGVRVKGRRVYDSSFGQSCHWCRQKTLDIHATCTKCGLHYCARCLLLRNGEVVETCVASGCWICPCCRGSCGPGCAGCCNCSLCRKKQGLAPTGQVSRLAAQHGFDNVHDYLIFLVTGETPEQIAGRKLKHGWGSFLQEQQLAQQPEEQPSSTSTAPEAGHGLPDLMPSTQETEEVEDSLRKRKLRRRQQIMEELGL